MLQGIGYRRAFERGLPDGSQGFLTGWGTHIERSGDFGEAGVSLFADDAKVDERALQAAAQGHFERVYGDTSLLCDSLEAVGKVGSERAHQILYRAWVR